MLDSVDPTDPIVATRIVEIQRAAYRVEAELIGFDGIPQLAESVEQVQALGSMKWRPKGSVSPMPILSRSAPRPGCS